MFLVSTASVGRRSHRLKVVVIVGKLSSYIEA